MSHELQQILGLSVLGAAFIVMALAVVVAIRRRCGGDE